MGEQGGWLRLFFIKKMPNNINLRCIEKIMAPWTIGKAKWPLVQQVRDLEYLRHKSTNMFRGMAAGYLVGPHPEDKDCASIL
jgi:hypothetical protein